MLKCCGKCKIEKPKSDFRKHSSRQDGTQNYCRDCHNKANRLWRESNREKHLESLRRWHKENYAHSRESNTRWAREHRESRRMKDARRRMLQTENGRFVILESEVRKLYASPCRVCGSKDNISADHITPLSRGGRHSIGNLQPLCKPCNSSKKDRLMIEWRYNLTSKKTLLTTP
jgi:5-methylcytosine-specific restriction endonuclease McrA